jgi:RNA polymerase sigma-70 factor (TIGR02960 family)
VVGQIAVRLGVPPGGPSWPCRRNCPITCAGTERAPAEDRSDVPTVQATGLESGTHSCEHLRACGPRIFAQRFRRGLDAFDYRPVELSQRLQGFRGELWLEPYPDALLEGAINTPLSPEARYEQSEAISLAFVTALQVLPARQLAVLILREVLGYHASEVAGMLGSTVESVNGALKRARASLQRRLPHGEREAPPAPGSPAEQVLLAKFVRAYESGDVDALVALLTDDVCVSMPPVPLEYQGRDDVARFYASINHQGRTYDLVPTRANGQPAFGAYLRAPAGGVRHGAGLLVVTLTGDRICAMVRFDNSVLPSFGLPRSLPS